MSSDAKFTDIDLNTSGATTIYDQSHGNTISGVYMKNGGSTAEVELQVTDGSNTATLAVPGAGTNLSFEGVIECASADSLQIDVTTKEGSSQTNTAVVFIRE